MTVRLKAGAGEIEDNYKRLCDFERVWTFFKAV